MYQWMNKQQTLYILVSSSLPFLHLIVFLVLLLISSLEPKQPSSISTCIIEKDNKYMYMIYISTHFIIHISSVNPSVHVYSTAY